MDMGMLNGLAGGSPDIHADIHTGNPLSEEVVCNQVDHRPHVGLLS
jgi:hypothetical protein